MGEKETKAEVKSQYKKVEKGYRSNEGRNKEDKQVQREKRLKGRKGEKKGKKRRVGKKNKREKKMKKEEERREGNNQNRRRNGNRGKMMEGLLMGDRGAKEKRSDRIRGQKSCQRELLRVRPERGRQNNK